MSEDRLGGTAARDSLLQELLTTPVGRRWLLKVGLGLSGGHCRRPLAAVGRASGPGRGTLRGGSRPTGNWHRRIFCTSDAAVCARRTRPRRAEQHCNAWRVGGPREQPDADRQRATTTVVACRSSPTRRRRAQRSRRRVACGP